MKDLPEYGYWTSSLRSSSLDPPSAYFGGRTLETKVVGVTYDGRQAVVKKLHTGEGILLRREPSNPFDSKAIRVERLSGEQIGYLGRYLAAELSPIFDAFGRPVKGQVSKLTGRAYWGYPLGVTVLFPIPEVDADEKGDESNDEIDFD